MISSEGARRIESWGAHWGWFDGLGSAREALLLVSSVRRREEIKLPTSSQWQSEHFLRSTDVTPYTGVWYEVKPQLQDIHRFVNGRILEIPTEMIRDHVLGGWRIPPPDRLMPVLTFSRGEDGEDSQWSIWWVSSERAIPGGLAVIDDRSPLEFLVDAWPVDMLSSCRATVVGVGSIGSVVAETLADYAIGCVALVDPDRLLQHNLVRHRLTRRHLGRFKVNAMGDVLRERHPDLEIEQYAIDAIHDADLLRPLFDRSSVVVCATDGVASRRVVNHLARRAGVPAVLACVLEDGAFGEVVRVHPGTGCLLCYRAGLADAGVLDPEPRLERDYTLGPPHLPMTAVAGDLALVGTIAAKVTIATILEQNGEWPQRLPGDVAVVGLRPVPGVSAPFDVEQAGAVKWTSLGPRRSDCPTCAAA